MIRKLLVATTVAGALSGGAMAAGATFYVEPSGDISGAADWASITAALEAASAAGPGNEVRLGIGTFHLRKSIVAWDFDGVFSGAGSGATTIRTAPGVEFDITANPIRVDFNEHDASMLFPSTPR